MGYWCETEVSLKLQLPESFLILPGIYFSFPVKGFHSFRWYLDRKNEWILFNA
jgi:hypothetical protein